MGQTLDDHKYFVYRNYKRNGFSDEFIKSLLGDAYDSYKKAYEMPYIDRHFGNWKVRLITVVIFILILIGCFLLTNH